MTKVKPLEYGLSGNLVVKLSPKPKKKVFVICPVRNVSEETNNKIAAYVAKLESEGYELYWPRRDNPHQNTDNIGIEICEYNRKRMLAADEIHIWYDKGSTGSIFDIGMFFAFVHVGDFKKFVIINREDVASTPGKSFENVILTLAKEFDNPVANGLKESWAKKYGK